MHHPGCLRRSVSEARRLRPIRVESFHAFSVEPLFAPLEEGGGVTVVGPGECIPDGVSRVKFREWGSLQPGPLRACVCLVRGGGQAEGTRLQSFVVFYFSSGRKAREHEQRKISTKFCELLYQCRNSCDVIFVQQLHGGVGRWVK